jgi:signal recognition particle GTPase
MSTQSQKRKYVRRKKVVQTLPEEQTTIAPPPTPQIINQFQFYSNIKSIQDEEYEMSMMMDIIKMQEREEKERLEKEREKQMRDNEELEENIKIRDHNIKEMLRKLKHGNSTSLFETNIINLLEHTMESQDMQIHIDDPLFYNQLCCYLGIGDDNKKSTIRLPESVRIYAKSFFVFTHQK